MELSKWQQAQKQKAGYADGKNHKNNYQKSRKGYIGAPYNFVPFYENPYQYPEKKLTAHNAAAEDLFTGEIT